MEISMMEGPGADTSPGTPSQRALGAMESAVRRARETQGALPPPVLPPPMPALNQPDRLHPPAAEPDPGGDHNGARDRTDRWLVVAVAVAAVLVAVAAIGLAVSMSRGSQLTATRSPTVTTPAPASAAVTPSSGRTHTKGGGAAGGSGRRTTTSTTPVSATPGGPPVISSLTPSSGSAGEGIEVAGANFLSPTGQIEARFDGQVAATSCPAQNTCTVTVPPSSGSSSAQVTITTASGTSNPVTFSYG